MDLSFRPAAGQIIAGQFRLERKLGEGGMGELFLARQLELERRVVLKFVNAQLGSERPESAADAQISQPNVVQLYTFGYERGRAFLVMEYVSGALAEELSLDALPEARALHIAAQIAADVSPALEAAVMRYLHKDPEQRFASADELRQALLGASHEPVAHEPARATQALASSRPLPFSPATQTEASEHESREAAQASELKAPRAPFAARLFAVLGPVLALVGVWIWFDAMAKVPGNPITRLYARLERAAAEEEGAASSWVPSALPGALHAVSQEGADHEKQLGEAAHCLNRNADRGYDSYFRYASWVDLARGPEPKGRGVLGLYTLTGPEDCAEQPLYSADRALAERLASFARAVHALDRETTRADHYYEQQAYKDDAMRLGQSMHGPLLAAFQAFGERERALRSLLATRRAERDRALLASLSPGPEHAFHTLRLAAQALAELGLCSPEQMHALSSERFKQALEAFGSALAQLEASGATADVVAEARALQETGAKFLRKLGPKPGWSRSDRASLHDRLTGWMLDGSPHRLAHDAEALTDAMNRSEWLEQRGIVLAKPLIAYLPR